MQDVRKAGRLPVEQSWLADLIKRVMPALGAGHRDSWHEGSVNRRIFSALMTVGALTAVVKVVSTLKEMTVARQFGVGDGFDAFLIAYMLPSFAINLVAGSFNAALIPTYIQVRELEGREAAQKLLSSMMLWSGVLLVAISILMAAGSPFVLPILASGFPPEKLELTSKLFFILLPLLPLSGSFIIWSAAMNAGERFAFAAITPIITPLTAIAIIYSLGNSWGIYSYAIAVITGAIIEGAFLASALARQGISVIPRWHGFSSAMKQVMKQYTPIILGGAIMSSTGLVDQAMAAMLGRGSVSTLNYGNRVGAVAISIGSMAVSTAILPQFSRMVAGNDWSGVRATLKAYTRLILVTTVPVTLVLVVVSHPIVALIFERGAFNSGDTVQVASVQSMYLLQIPFYVLGTLFVRLTSALRANHILMWGAVISFVLNVILDYFFMNWLGVAGIALSTSLVYLVSLCYLVSFSRRLLAQRDNAR